MAITSRRIGVKRKERKMLLTGLIVFLMIASVLGYAAYQWDAGETYNGYEFVRIEDYWTTDIGNARLQFHFLPADVEDIELAGNVDYEEYFLVHNSSANMTPMASSTMDLVKYEMYLHLKEKFGIPAELATTEKTNASRMAIACKDATPFIGVIEYSYANNTQIVNENNCIKVEAESESMMVKANDRLLYGLAGII